MSKEVSKEDISNEAAEELLKRWADFLELDTDGKLYKAIVEELRLSVKKSRLTFDEETEIFRYHLIKPIDEIEIVEIKECTFSDKKFIQKFSKKQTMDSAEIMLGKYTKLSVEQVGKLRDRDINKINSVVMGFLAQVAPGEE